MVKKDVDEADKILLKTLEKIDLLTPQNLTEIKSYKVPPNKVNYVFIATCILMLPEKLFQLKKSWSDDDVNDYFWKIAQTELLNDTHFFDKLKNIDF